MTSSDDPPEVVLLDVVFFAGPPFRAHEGAHMRNSRPHRRLPIPGQPYRVSNNIKRRGRFIADHDELGNIEQMRFVFRGNGTPAVVVDGTNLGAVAVDPKGRHITTDGRWKVTNGGDLPDLPVLLTLAKYAYRLRRNDALQSIGAADRVAFVITTDSAQVHVKIKTRHKSRKVTITFPTPLPTEKLDARTAQHIADLLAARLRGELGVSDPNVPPTEASKQALAASHRQ